MNKVPCVLCGCKALVSAGMGSDLEHAYSFAKIKCSNQKCGNFIKLYYPDATSSVNVCNDAI